MEQGDTEKYIADLYSEKPETKLLYVTPEMVGEFKPLMLLCII